MFGFVRILSQNLIV